jgi:hypothetical protein
VAAEDESAVGQVCQLTGADGRTAVGVALRDSVHGP